MLAGTEMVKHKNYLEKQFSARNWTSIASVKGINRSVHMQHIAERELEKKMSSQVSCHDYRCS